MAKNITKIALITFSCVSVNLWAYNQENNYGSNSNSNSSSSVPFASITNQLQNDSNLLKAPSLNAFGDDDLNDANWDTVDFDNSDTGTTGWSGGSGGKGATSGKNPFGFPDEDFTPVQESASTLGVG